MASIKRLKKEIDNVIYQVISDCFVFSEVNQGSRSEAVSEIIENAVDLRNELFSRINNSGTFSDAKAVKSYYQAIKDDLNKGADKLFEKLSSISKKKKK